MKHSTAARYVVRFAIVLAFAFASIIASAGEARAIMRITPLTVTLHWSVAAPNPAAVSVKLSDGTTAYLLWLEPVRDADGRLSTLELVLRPKARSSKVIENLLAPPGNRHGYQLFMFGARDFAEGIARSAYGATRDFDNAQTPLRVKATVTKVSVVPTGPQSVLAFGFATLELRVEIDNPPK
jgi:hypothetical protein